ncbi:MAG: beta-glucosidase [Gammaproteobacteria bacterium]|nr:beta-glucosidase [Gammaproteobacteria bacterium]MCP5425597.1 beta-glucosidase [Gammaproteobacteria bacterium]MCP5459003.1 beta-glucosidase [Gammaproteobacteria bacterium]
MTTTPEFPANFLWGAATSAYQIEGSPLADGAGPSIWHPFSHTPGHTRDGDTGDVACDHYRRYAQDVRLMRSLGLNAYRFSLSWSRVFPNGRGRLNAAGLAFYERLVDTLLAHDLQPFATLYHWDLPLALQERGGWLNRGTAGWFADYAQQMFKALGDRVLYWTTLNEPWVVVDAAYLHAAHPPALGDWRQAPWAAHHLLLAHGLAVQAGRAEGRQQIGIVINLEPQYPVSDSTADQEAAWRAHVYMNRFYLDALRLGRYPRALQSLFADAWPDFPEEDLRIISQPVDYLGINYYARSRVRHDPQAPLTQASRVIEPGRRYTDLDWEVYPQGLTETLCWVKRRYGEMPLYITENGAAFADPPVQGDRLDDPLRVAYLREHLRAAYAALEQGVDLRGYFVWSLLDNFEWAQGYSKRFGIVHVDYATQRRIPKASAQFYADVIRGRGGEALRDSG